MVNKVILIGNLGRDAEIKVLPNGTKVARFPIATNENFKDKNGAWQTVTDWHDIVAWRQLAERAERDCRKGKMIYVEGKLRRRKYTDQSGIERVAVEIEAENIRALEKREDRGDIEQYHQRPEIKNTPTNDDSTEGFQMMDEMPF